MAHALGMVNVTSEEGFVDLDMPLVSAKRNLFGGHRVQACGSLDGVPVGLAIEFGSSWTPQPTPDPSQVFQVGRASLISLGPESDMFVQALDRLYGTSLGLKAMSGPVAVDAIALQGDPKMLHKQPVRFKLFFNAGGLDESAYAEVFVVVLPEQSRLLWNEKDMEYRPGVVHAMAGAAG